MNQTGANALGLIRIEFEMTGDDLYNMYNGFANGYIGCILPCLDERDLT